MDILFLDFVNSAEKDYRTGETQEHLEEPGWLDGLLVRYKLTLPTPASPVILTVLRELRTLLRRMIEALIDEQSFREADVAALNQYLSKAKLRRVIQAGHDYHLELVPETRNWEWVMAEVVASFAEFMVQEATERLKVCENPNCGWLFYDESKSHTRRWCSDSSCGNLLKVRRFRERHKATSPKNS